MHLRELWAVVSTAGLLALTGCHNDAPSATDDSVQAVPSVSGTVTAKQNSSRSVTITFTSSDGHPISDLSADVGSLPSGWSGPGTFSCARVTSGSGCVLTLTYQPTVLGSGTLTLRYSYTNNDFHNETGTVSLDYATTSDDNVVATASPTGQIAATPGSTQPVTVTFTTDDGQPATNLILTTSLGALPTGWLAGASSFTCSSVSTGSGCQLALTYAPQVVGGGTLILNYSYTDNEGTAKTGALNLSYASTTNDSVVGTVSPTGQITTTVGGNTTVTVTFATNDGNPATELAISSSALSSSLPSGWNSPASSLSCPTVSNGTVCTLSLSYAPSAAASGTLSLPFSYNNDAGSAETGTVSISYLANLPHLYVANFGSAVKECTLNSNGTVSACAAAASSGGAATPSGIAFSGNTVYETDYNNGVIDVCTVNSDGSFSSCSAQVTGLMYPWALTISGSYLYVTSVYTYGSVMACPIASDGSLSTCSATGVGVATGIAIDNGYAYISAGPGSSTVMNKCVVNGDGTLSGCVSTGSGFNQPGFVTASGNYVYVSDAGSTNLVSVCTIGSAGALTNCATSAISGGYSPPNYLAISGNNAYISSNSNHIYLCTVSSSDGSLSNCNVADGGGSFSTPQQMAFH